jgi:hypothetical protein
LKCSILLKCILLSCLFCGCTKDTVKNNRGTALSLKSSKEIYKPGEKLELMITIDTSQSGICILDGFYLTHWTSRIYQSPNFGQDSWLSEDKEKEGGESAFCFSKPVSKWSEVPFVVLEFEVLDLYGTDVYGPYYEEISPDKSKVIRITPDKSWHGTRAVNGTMLKNFTVPGRYALRATLNQPEDWINRVKGVSSQTIIIEIKHP